MFSDVVHFSKLVHDATTWDFGATQITPDDVAKNWLADNVTTGGVPMTGGVGMFNDYASIHAFWADTTNMDNLRGADITNHSIAGSIEDETRGGSTVHTPSSTYSGGPPPPPGAPPPPPPPPFLPPPSEPGLGGGGV